MDTVGALYTLRRELWIPAPRERVFRFFSDARNLESITPPWLNFCVLTPGPIEMKAGAGIQYRLAWRFFPLRWTTRIVEWKPPDYFIDEQTRGPYRAWRHTHTFREENGGTRMLDSVEYALPFGLLGRLAHAVKVRHDIEGIFDYRADAIGRIFT
jgi:ligand-binding SRPBCC domain-containing protein